ncbi:MAG: LysR family transcriptional regulator [Burkholderiaceae bacterium]
MELDSFLFFAAVVEAGSFSNAARKLGIDRSNVSRRINRLEVDVGAQLLRRTTRQMKLTELGEALFERCNAISAEVDRARLVVQSPTESVRGPIHVSCHPVMGRLYLADLFNAFCLRYPEVSLKITLDGNADDLVGLGIDVAMRITNEPASAFVARRLASIDWVICASPQYLKKAGTPRDPQALTQHAWCGVRSRMSLDLVRAARHGRVVLSARLQCADYAVLKNAMIAGLGIGLLPAYAARDELRAGTLQTVLKGYTLAPSPGNTLYAVTSPTRYMPPQIRAFLDYLKESFEVNPFEA